MKTKTTLCMFAVLLVAMCNVLTVNAQERILAIQEPFVILIDPADGTILDPQFINLTPQTTSTPKAILQVGDELWVSDQITDEIYRYDLTGAFISTITGGMDNIKGMALINNSEIWLTNAGSNNGAPGNAIVRLDTDGNNLGNYPTVGSSFDIIDTGTDVLISYIGAETKIERRDYDGNVLGNVVGTGVVNFMQQIEINDTNQSVYTAVFSVGGNGPGLYEFSISDGSILEYYDLGSLRGVAQLDDGNILYTSGNNLNLLDPGSGNSSLVSAGGASQYLARVDLMPCTPAPTPTGDAIQSLPDGSTVADIVVSPTTVTWYATASDALSNTDPLDPTTLLEDGEDYFAVAGVGDCPSNALEVTVNLILGIDDVNNTAVKVYPNPVTDVLQISNETSIERVTIHSVLGQLVIESRINDTNATIDMSQLANGLYVITVHSEGRATTVKVIKE